MSVAETQCWSSRLLSKLKAPGRPSRVAKATLPPVRGEMSENSEVQRALSSPSFLAPYLSSSSVGWMMEVDSGTPNMSLQEAE